MSKDKINKKIPFDVTSQKMLDFIDSKKGVYGTRAAYIRSLIAADMQSEVNYTGFTHNMRGQE